MLRYILSFLYSTFYYIFKVLCKNFLKSLTFWYRSFEMIMVNTSWGWARPSLVESTQLWFFFFHRFGIFLKSYSKDSKANAQIKIYENLGWASLTRGWCASFKGWDPRMLNLWWCNKGIAREFSLYYVLCIITLIYNPQRIKTISVVISQYIVFVLEILLNMQRKISDIQVIYVFGPKI